MALFILVQETGARKSLLMNNQQKYSVKKDD